LCIINGILVVEVVFQVHNFLNKISEVEVINT